MKVSTPAKLEDIPGSSKFKLPSGLSVAVGKR